jgi:hypothetical protein
MPMRIGVPIDYATSVSGEKIVERRNGDLGVARGTGVPPH